MDFETFVQSLTAFLKQSDNLYFILYSVASCLLTQIIKKLFIDKVKTEVLHRFDFAEVLPFLFGAVFAVVDLLFVQRQSFGWAFVEKILMSAATIGAFATAIFKAVSSISGKSLKSLLKDDTFCVFYTQLQILATVRQQFSDKSLTLSVFVSQTQQLAKDAKEIYQNSETAEGDKKQALTDAIAQIFGEEAAAECVEILHTRLYFLFCSSDVDK